MAKGWSIQSSLRNNSREKCLSLSEAVERAVFVLGPNLFNDLEIDEKWPQDYPTMIKKLLDELEQYVETGNCLQGNETSSVINPTFLEPTTRKWLVGHIACPFSGYFPLPIELLKQKEDASSAVTIVGHCQSVLKKLLASLRARNETLKFSFHPCDALVFCYSQSPDKFDLIDTSNLVDTIGFVNVLNAAARKLRSDQSVLLSETMKWAIYAPDIVDYVQKMLCCPLSFIPTVYGLRLMDNIELGSETPRSFNTLILPPSRLRWKKASPVVGVPLVVSSSLELCLQRLKKMCFLTTKSGSASPLTFCYVLSDLCRRGGLRDPSHLMESLFFGLAPVFKKSLDTIQAWMNRRPVWQVKITIPFSVFDTGYNTHIPPILRLVLVPTSDFFAGSLDDSSTTDKFIKLNSTKNHFIDNVGLSLRLTPDGGIDQVEMSFLLADRSLLDTHCGIVVDQRVAHWHLFVIGRLCGRRCQVEPFDLPYPWDLERPVESSQSPGNSEMIAESCQETEDAYIIHFKIPSVKRSKAPSGKSKNY